MPLRTRRIVWFLYFFIIILAAFVVPYTLLRDVESFSGPFLFWCLFALAAIAGMWFITSRWKDSESDI